LLISPFVYDSFLSNKDGTLTDKIGFISDYNNLWSQKPYLLFIGQGLGGGIVTELRGLTYNLEVTYFEIIRTYGLIGFVIFLLFIYFPILFYIIKRSKFANNKFRDYFYFTYFVYSFVEIPSNPLLFSSNGFLLLLIVYSDLFYMNHISDVQ
jgi:hypothetical protein